MKDKLTIRRDIHVDHPYNCGIINYMRRRNVILLIIVVLVFLSTPLFSQGDTILNIKSKALITGTAIGLGVSIFHGILLFGYTPNVSITEKLIGFSVPAIVCIATSILSTNLFFDIFSNDSMNKWLSLPLGALAGFIEGALIGGITYSVFFSVMEVMDPDFSRAKNVLDAALMGLLGGGVFGGLIGILPGIGVAVLIRFTI